MGAATNRVANLWSSNEREWEKKVELEILSGFVGKKEEMGAVAKFSRF